MHFSKLKVSADASSKLRSLRQRTGITPNLLCRYALMSSLEEGPVGSVPPPDQNGQEFNAYTLTGDLTELFVGLLRFVEEGDQTAPPLGDEDVLERLRAHIHRGVGSLSVRLKSAADLAVWRENPAASPAAHDD